MKIIFLDCDGVLNSQKFFNSGGGKHRMGDVGLSFGASQLDPAGLALVDKIVDATGAKIVISSSWRHIWDWHEIAAMFQNRGFKNVDSIIGKTGNSKEDHRGTEVAEWLGLDRERQVVDDNHDPISTYVILDDNDEFDTSQHPHFVRTNPQTGITERDVQKAIQILSQG
jgi:hypothetical protein